MKSSDPDLTSSVINKFGVCLVVSRTLLMYNITDCVNMCHEE